MTMIKVEKLNKEFPAVKAVDNISFEVSVGEIFGLVGPNGAGKTTCLNILATLLQPTSGEVWIDGKKLRDNIPETRQKIGYMPDFFGTYRKLSFFEYLDFYGGCYGMPFKERMKRIDEVIEMTGLGDKRNEQVDDLSRGMKQRLCLAKTLLHNPKVLLLDEPASGLDPRARIQIRNILKQASDSGITILISSHILSDLQNICSDIAIIETGRLVKRGTIKELLARQGPVKIWHVEVTGNPQAGKEILEKCVFLKDVMIDANRLIVRTSEDYLKEGGVQPEDVSAEILRKLLEVDCKITSFNEDQGDLEDAYLSYTEGILG